jgi:hypothetical protein
VIDKAWKLFLDTSLSQIPKQQIRILFTEPVSVGSPSVLKFQDPTGAEKEVLLSEALPDSAVGGLSISWSFTVAPGSPNVPGEKWKVAISAVDRVKDAAGNPSHPANPWRLIDAKLPPVIIGELVAEKPGKSEVVPDPAQVHKSFVLLSSSQPISAVREYTPLHPEKAEDWLKTDYTDSHGLAVFTFKLSHPAKLKLMVYDNLGQFVNQSEVEITRNDLQSGKLARDPVTRAYNLRLGWFPVSRDGNRISTGAYILRASFEYGLDPRDYVEKGSKVKVTKFGFVRNSGLRGLGLP